MVRVCGLNGEARSAGAPLYALRCSRPNRPSVRCTIARLDDGMNSQTQSSLEEVVTVAGAPELARSWYAVHALGTLGTRC